MFSCLPIIYSTLFSVLIPYINDINGHFNYLMDVHRCAKNITHYNEISRTSLYSMRNAQQYLRSHLFTFLRIFACCFILIISVFFFLIRCRSQMSTWNFFQNIKKNQLIKFAINNSIIKTKRKLEQALKLKTVTSFFEHLNCLFFLFRFLFRNCLFFK
jgi:hypothetical protein